MTSLQEIINAAKIGENTDWEFKSARGGFPGSFWETYSAMANSEGGRVVLGVKEAPSRAILDGLTESDITKYRKILWDGLNDRGTVSINLLDNNSVETIAHEEKFLLLVTIPRASRLQRPVFLSRNPFGNTYRRYEEGDYRCDDEEVRRMFADAQSVPADNRLLRNFSMADLDQPSITQYRQRLRAVKGDHPWLNLGDRELLEQLGGWRKDRSTGEEGLTVAGLLMFGKDSVIRDPDAIPSYFVDYREKLDPTIRWSDRLYPDGTWEANLFQFYSRCWPKISLALPVPFALEKGVRQDETPAHEALREAFVNAIIHADYTAPGGVIVERYPDQFIIENPGVLLVSLEQYRSGGVSECRNKALQKMFLMIGGGEQAGSGAYKVRTGWLSRNWRTPRIILRPRPDRVSLVLPMISLIPAETRERLHGIFGTMLETMNPSEQQALATADIEGQVSNVRLQELTSDHPVEISRMLQRLCEKGWLVSDNRRRWTTYKLPHEQKQLSLFSSSPGESSQKADSTHIKQDLTHNEPSLLHNEPDSTHNMNSDLNNLATTVAGKQRATPTSVRATILVLCHGRYLSAKELASLLKRNSAGLRSRYLGPMVSEGSLKLRFPDKPNHVDQAYTAS